MSYLHEEEEQLISKDIFIEERPRRSRKSIFLAGAMCLLAASGICAYMAVTNDMKSTTETTTYEANTTTAHTVPEEDTYLGEEPDLQEEKFSEYMTEAEFFEHVKNQVAGLDDDIAEIERCAQESWNEVSGTNS